MENETKGIWDRKPIGYKGPWLRIHRIREMMFSVVDLMPGLATRWGIISNETDTYTRESEITWIRSCFTETTAPVILAPEFFQTMRNRVPRQVFVIFEILWHSYLTGSIEEHTNPLPLFRLCESVNLKPDYILTNHPKDYNLYQHVLCKGHYHLCRFFLKAYETELLPTLSNSFVDTLVLDENLGIDVGRLLMQKGYFSDNTFRRLVVDRIADEYVLHAARAVTLLLNFAPMDNSGLILSSAYLRSKENASKLVLDPLVERALAQEKYFRTIVIVYKEILVKFPKELQDLIVCYTVNRIRR
jgi:hypothetical protein